jgi:hypothetical protein
MSTIYVGPEATGDGTGSDPDNLISLTDARALAQAGDEVNVAAGDYPDYGYLAARLIPISEDA